MNILEQIENRFKEISNLKNIKLDVDKIQKDNNRQAAKTDKTKSKRYGEVFTPLYFVDQMIYKKLDSIHLDSFTFDLCAGYGQFSVRLLRILFQKYNIDVEKWLKYQHTFTQFQISSCAKLIYIFGSNINLYVGDSLNIKYSTEEENGILFFNNEEKRWYNILLVTELVHTYKDDLDALTFIFNNATNDNELQKLKDGKIVFEKKETEVESKFDFTVKEVINKHPVALNMTEQFLTNNHYLTELQPENCAVLVYIFGPNINLYVGDSMNLKYSTEDDKGILFFNEKTKVWEHNTLIDGLLTKETFNTNKQFLSFIFNNYKDSKKIIDFVNDIKSGKIELQKNEEQVEEITVEKVPEVIEQINGIDESEEEVKVKEQSKEKKQKENKPKKQVKKSIGNNTKEEADAMFGFAPLKIS